MISAEHIRRLSALSLSAEALQEVLSIIADIQSACDTRREELRQKLEQETFADAERRARNANRMRTVRAQCLHGADTVQQERSPTPPKEIISNLLPSETPFRKQERFELVALAEDDWPQDFREQFWAAYPKRVGKKGALAKLLIVRRSGTVTFLALMAAVERYRRVAVDRKFTKDPETWLNKGCWDDEFAAAVAESAPRQGIYVEFTDPAREAWDAYGRSIGKNYPVDKRGGWEFPTRWPPGYSSEGIADVQANQH